MNKKEKLNSYIEMYIEGLTEQSSSTVGDYTEDLKMFNDYLDSNKIDLVTADLGCLQGYSRHLKEDKKYAPATRNRKLQLVKYLYQYLQNTKVITENPAEHLALPKIPERLPKFLTVEEAQRLLLEIDKEKNDFLSYRDKAMMMIFLNHGLRVSELANLKLDSINGDILTFIGKGNKERSVVLNNDTITAINDYLSVRKETETDYLFISTRKKQIAVRTIQATLEKYMKQAELENHGVHALRHSAAVYMIEQGVGIRTIQKLFGHQSVETTEIYASVTEKSKRQASEKMQGLFG